MYTYGASLKISRTDAFCSHVYYLSWPLGFCISASVWMVLNTAWPPRGLGQTEDEHCDESIAKDEKIDDVPEKFVVDIEQAVAELHK